MLVLQQDDFQIWSKIVTFSFSLEKYFASYFTDLLEAYGETFEHLCQKAMTLHFCSEETYGRME